MKDDNHAVLLSGGIDSTTVLGMLLNARPDTNNIFAVSIRYPSKHNDFETSAAIDICNHYGVFLLPVDFTSVFKTFNSALLTSSAEKIPEDHYQDDNMKKTVIPMRNVIFAAGVAGHLLSLKDERWYLHIGSHLGDHEMYPDCRSESVRSLGIALYENSDNKVKMFSPLISKLKTDIVKIGLDIDVPYHLTRTCYTDNQVACGKCGSCVERLDAFDFNEAVDPIEYR